YKYADYLKVPGVLTFEEKEKFPHYIHRLAYDKTFYETYVEKQQQCMRDWGNLDGCAGERLLHLFASMTGKVSSGNTSGMIGRQL
ncbi:MAG TPA: hypothetical protein VN631_13960, partial [Negativicutes bacterium]|nr:hypothetical protein [Negativicutes bacterium]